MSAIQGGTSTPTVITLTLNEEASEHKTGALVAQRSELAKVFQFTYTDPIDLIENIRHALDALTELEANPPVPPDPTKPPRKEAKPPTPPEDSEPTIDVPLRKGTVAIKISHLKIISGETDAAAYRQAVLIAGRLIDGKLWDGKSPIRIDDAYATMRKIQHLKDAEFSLFSLEDFVQTGNEEEVQPDPIVSG